MNNIIVVILIIIWLIAIIAMINIGNVEFAGVCTALMFIVLYDRYKKRKG